MYSIFLFAVCFTSIDRSRFVFISNAAGALKLDMDVRFKVNDLDLTPYLSGPLRHGGGGEEGGAPVFNLYGCVCHFGSGQ